MFVSTVKIKFKGLKKCLWCSCFTTFLFFISYFFNFVPWQLLIFRLDNFSIDALQHWWLFLCCFVCFLDLVMISSDWFLGYFVGNTLWLIAIGYYLYITFLGYNGKYPAHHNAACIFLICFWFIAENSISLYLSYIRNEKKILFFLIYEFSGSSFVDFLSLNLWKYWLLISPTMCHFVITKKLL